jgi:hypothetical protein
MHDMSVFTEVATLRAKPSGRDVSLSALEIHVRVVDHTVHGDCPWFITDHAIELCLVGWWRRIDGGYVINDDELIRQMSRTSVARRFTAACRRVWKALNSEKFIPL